MPTLPAIQFPLIGNSLVVGLFSLLHIALAGLSVGFMVLAPVFEWKGRSQPFALDLARAVTRFTVIVFSVSTVLAVIMVELVIGLFPVTTMWVWNQFRGPIALGIAAFVVQLLVLYPYYHYWDRIILRRPSLHLALGAAAAFFMLVWVSVLDGMGSYMLTPVERPGSWANLTNPTWLPLVFHRLIGDVLIAGYVIAAYGSWRTGRPADRSQHAYYLYLARVGWAIGLAALLLQPFSGWLYAWGIRSSAPEAYEQLVRGPYQPLVYVQFVLIGLLFIGNHLVLRTAASARPRWLDMLVVASAIAMVASVGQTTFRRTMLFVLLVLILWGLARLWSTGRMADIGGGIRVRPVMAGLGIVAVLTYLTMGTIRETARRPDTVRNMISLQDEAKHPAAFREGRTPQAEKPVFRTERRD
jgi:hypothetical protein